MHGVYFDENTLILAQTLGLDNLSEFCRDAVSYFVSGCDRELTPTEIRELSKKFAHEKRAALLKQQKITGQTDEERQKIQVARDVRLAKITDAVRLEVTRIGPDRFRKYLEDTSGDYVTILDDVMEEVSRSTGYPVEFHDIVAAYKRVQA